MSRYGRRSSIEIDPVYLVFALILGLWALLLLVFHAYNPFRGHLYWWNLNPWWMLGSGMFIVCGIIRLIKSLDSSYLNILDHIAGFLAIAGFVMAVWNIFTYSPSVMIGLRNETQYQTAEVPLPITDFRVSSYAEASENFSTQNPDARFHIQNLNYVRDQWVAEYGPLGFWNTWGLHTQGFYEYNSLVSPNPVFVPNEMPFAEQGIGGNSLRVRIAKRDPFAFYEDALFAPDPDFPGRYMTVVTLTKRHGMSRVPYISNVVVIHLDNRPDEWLTPEQASVDPRFVGLQITPEWLASMRAAAYGYTHGLRDAMFRRTGLLQVQISSTNAENTPPYHLRSGNDMYWVTPLSPYKTPSFKALAWQQSNVLNAPTYIWMVPGGNAFSGIDALVSKIKTAEGHPEDIVWVTNNAGTLSGEIDVLEMLPITHNNQLYFVGYAALGSKPQKTRMYVTVRASDGVVMQNQFSVAEVNDWLKGPNDLAALTPNAQTDVVTDITNTGLDLSGYSTQELWELLDNVTDEIRKRGAGDGLMSGPFGKMSYENDDDLYSLARSIAIELFTRNFK